MRPASLVWLLSAVLLANAIPIPEGASELTNRTDGEIFDVDEASVDRRDLDEMVDVEKRAKAKAKAKAPARAPAAAKAAKAKPPKPPTTSAKPPTNTPEPPTTSPKPPTKSLPKPSATTSKLAATSPKPPATPKPTAKPSATTSKSAATSPKPPATSKPTAKPSATTSKSAATTPTSSACPIKKKPTAKGPRRIVDYFFEKRAPGKFSSANAPATITVKLNNVEFNLQKFGAQGGRGLTYRVVDGPSRGDFAKTNFNGKSEVENTTAAGQLVASGRDQNVCNEIQAEWLITKASPGKKLTETTAFQAAVGNQDECKAVVGKAVKAGGKALLNLHEITGGGKDHKGNGLNHNDISEDNVRFNDEVTEGFLIDFGESTRGPSISGKDLKAALDAVFDPNDLCP